VLAFTRRFWERIAKEVTECSTRRIEVVRLIVAEAEVADEFPTQGARVSSAVDAVPIFKWAQHAAQRPGRAFDFLPAIPSVEQQVLLIVAIYPFVRIGDCREKNGAIFVRDRCRARI